MQIGHRLVGGLVVGILLVLEIEIIVCRLGESGLRGRGKGDGARLLLAAVALAATDEANTEEDEDGEDDESGDDDSREKSDFLRVKSMVSQHSSAVVGKEGNEVDSPHREARSRRTSWCPLGRP